jgi:predicted nucleotidyltransferase
MRSRTSRITPKINKTGQTDIVKKSWPDGNTISANAILDKESYDINDDNRIKILKLFFNGPNTRLHVREVARRSNLTPRGAQNILRSLKNEGLLDNESTDIVNNYWGNYNNQKFIGLKRALNLYSLYSTRLISTLESYYKNPKCVVLFGSYSRGEDTGESDIDIAIITSRKDLPDTGKFEDALKRKISIHLIKNVKEETSNFTNALANGIILSGYLEVI